MQTRFLLFFVAIFVLPGCQKNASTQGPAPAPTQRPTAESPDLREELTARLYVKGMSCPLCANNIDKQLLRVRGVQRVSVDLGTGLVLAKLAPANPPTREQLAGAIAESGFTLDRIEMPEPKGASND